MGEADTAGRWAGHTRRTVVGTVVIVAMVVLSAAPGGAITGGEPDAGRHPWVGGTVIFLPPIQRTIVNCTGTLVAPSVFVTAAHCGRDGARIPVTFDEDFDAATSVRYPGTFITHPDYDPAFEFRRDVAVIVLDEPIAVDPADLPRLPSANLLGQMNAAGALDPSTKFTFVGYGFLGYENGPGGKQPIIGQDRYLSVGSYQALNKDRLRTSQNPTQGDGGTCDGDSGAPNFLGAGAGETDIVVALTSTGDTYCRATNVAYRLDTLQARSFLAGYLTLP